MLFTNILFSSLLAPVKIENPRDSCTIKTDLIKTTLYEAFIPIDALVFIIGTTGMSKSEVNLIVTDVINVKNSILKDTGSIAKIFNLSDKINEKGEIKHALSTRIELVRRDESFIFKDLVQEYQSRIMGCLDKFRNKELYDPKLDKQYRKMIERIYDAIYENLDIQDTISKEKEELFREYKAISPTEIQRTKIALSLGSNIFNLSELIRILSRINLKDKEKFVRECVNSVFDAVEKASIAMASKNFIEQKYLAKEFIKNSSEAGPSNNAFEARSAIIRAAQLTPDEIKDLAAKQSQENQRLLESVSNMQNQTWIIRYNKQIKEDLIVYLLTHQPEDKKRLLNHFQ